MFDGVDEISPMCLHKAVVVQTMLPKYRVPFFRRLSKSSDVQFTLAYGRSRPRDAQESIWLPDDVRFVHLNNVFFTTRKSLRFQGGLFPLLRSGKFDTVIAEFDYFNVSNMLACLWSRTKPIRFIWWGHGIRSGGPRYSVQFHKRMLNLADAVIFYDHMRARTVANLGVTSRKLFIALNTVDISSISPHVYDSRYHDNRFRIVYLGRLVPHKRVDLFIEVLIRVAPQLAKDIQVVIIGEGPSRDILETRALQAGLSEKILFVGPLYEESSLAPYLNTSLVSVSPGPVGLSAIHSLTYGIPMLVADAESHGPEAAILRDGVNCRFFEAGNPDSMARIMLEMLNDRKRLSLMGSTGQSQVQARYSMAGMVNGFSDAVGYAHGDILTSPYQLDHYEENLS